MWYACLKGACEKKTYSRKFVTATNSMSLATASLARARNAKLSAFAYRISTILFHSGTKFDDIFSLSRLGLCMSPDSTVDFQKKLGANRDSKILFWQKTSEEILLALNMLQAIKENQVPVLRNDDMDITTTIDLDEHVINGYPNVNSAVYGCCKELLEKTMRRRE